MSAPLLALSLMPDEDFRRAALPLFERGEVDAIEWSFDVAFDRPAPAWVDALLDVFAKEGRLYGHGVHLSPFSARKTERADRWLGRAKEERERRAYRRVSEHVGASRIGDLSRGAPLPVFPCAATIEAAQRDLARLREAMRAPVGLENLALAFSRDDVLAQGSLVEAVLAPFDGFVVLDLHNAWCQMTNFDVEADAWFDRWPLERVRAIHVSGGSWSTHEGKRFRRDTHDGELPREVLALLPRLLARAPNVEVVVFERLGGTIDDPAGFQADFASVKRALEASRARVDCGPFVRDRSVEGGLESVEALAESQDAFLAALESSRDAENALARMRSDARLAPFSSWIDRWERAPIDVARALVTKWSRREG